MEKKTSPMIRKFFKEEKIDHRCEVCGIDLLHIKRKFKVREFENGLIKNLIQSEVVKELRSYGNINVNDEVDYYLCTDHYNTVWAMKKGDKSWKDIINYCKKNKNVIILPELDLAKEELKKEINNALCNGVLEL
jgi:hypothetical protein